MNAAYQWIFFFFSLFMQLFFPPSKCLKGQVSECRAVSLGSSQPQSQGQRGSGAGRTGPARGRGRWPSGPAVAWLCSGRRRSFRHGFDLGCLAVPPGRPRGRPVARVVSTGPSSRCALGLEPGLLGEGRGGGWGAVSCAPTQLGPRALQPGFRTALSGQARPSAGPRL